VDKGAPQSENTDILFRSFGLDSVSLAKDSVLRSCYEILNKFGNSYRVDPAPLFRPLGTNQPDETY
jgi:hypothetical protein